MNEENWEVLYMIICLPIYYPGTLKIVTGSNGCIHQMSILCNNTIAFSYLHYKTILMLFIKCGLGIKICGTSTSKYM